MYPDPTDPNFFTSAPPPAPPIDLVSYHVFPGKAGRWEAMRRYTPASGEAPAVCGLGTYDARGEARAACEDDHNHTRLLAAATGATVRIVRRIT